MCICFKKVDFFKTCRPCAQNVRPEGDEAPLLGGGAEQLQPQPVAPCLSCRKHPEIFYVIFEC